MKCCSLKKKFVIFGPLSLSNEKKNHIYVYFSQNFFSELSFICHWLDKLIAPPPKLQHWLIQCCYVRLVGQIKQTKEHNVYFAC